MNGEKRGGYMVERYKMHSTSNQSAVIESRVLSSTNNTRLTLMPEIVRNSNHPEAKVKITLVHQRKARNGSWENEPSAPLSTLKAGEAKKFILDSDQTLSLHNELKNLYAIGDEVGVKSGNASLVVAPEAEVIVTDQNRARVINSLLSKGYSDEIWAALVESDPDLVTRLSYAQIQHERWQALALFETNMSKSLPESYWQQLFEDNKWIFGYGLNYRILKTVETQPRYGGTMVNGKGMQKGDFLQRTSAEVKFTVLVEIKKPGTDLLGAAEYRNGAHELSGELIGAVSQLHANCSKWEKEGSQTEENRERLSKENIFTVQPKGILVIGHTGQLDTISRRNTFEIFRRNLTNPEIITFDELFERSKFILEHDQLNDTTDDDQSLDPDWEDIPF
jgi:hypothetical protein